MKIMKRTAFLDWKQARSLFAAGVRIDFRGTKGGSGMSPMVKSILIYTVMGGIMAAGLIQNPSLFFYSAAVFTYSMLMTAMATLYELSNDMFNPEDAEVLSFRPLSDATILAAKTANLFFFTVLTGLGLCLIPAFIGLALPQSTWRFPISFVLISTFANLSAAFFISGLYPLLEEKLATERFKDAMVVVQVAATFVIFFLLQLFSRISILPPYPDAAASPLWFRFFPPVWFASGMLLVSGTAGGLECGLFLLGTATTVLFGALTMHIQSRRYRNWSDPVIRSGTETRPIEQKRTFVLFRRRAMQSEIRAGYELTSNLVKRDRMVKMGVFPLLGIPLAILAIRLAENKIPDPYSDPWTGKSIGSVSEISFLVFFVSIAMFYGFLYAKDSESSWIFHVSPIRSPGKLVSGVKRYLFLRILGPFFLLSAALHCIRIPVVHAVQVAFMLFLVSGTALSGASFFIRDYPFSKKGERGMRTRAFIFLAAALPVLALFLLLQQAARVNPVFWAACACGLLAVLVILEKVSQKRLDHVLKKKEYLL